MNEYRIFIEFTRPKSRWAIVSHIIRLVEKTEYSHVRLSWQSKSTGIPVVYEASGTNLKFKGPYADRNSVVIVKEYDIIITEIEHKKLLRLCLTYAGLSYGIAQLLDILLVKIFRLKKNPLSTGPKKQVCSELVGRFLEEVLGWETGLNLDIAGVRDIEKVLNKQKGN